MLCPFCQNEMTEGYLQAARQIIFTTKPKKAFITPRGDDVPVTGFWDVTCRAYHCDTCKKIVADYTDTSWDQFG